MDMKKVRLTASKGMRTDTDPRLIADDETLFMQNWDVVGTGMVVPRGGSDLIPRSGSNHHILSGKVIQTFSFSSASGTFIGCVVTKSGVEDKIFIRNITSANTTAWTAITTALDTDNGAQHDMTLEQNSPRWQAIQEPGGIMLVWEAGGAGVGVSNAIFIDGQTANTVAYRAHTPLFSASLITPQNPHYSARWGSRTWWIENGFGIAGTKLLYTQISSGVGGFTIDGTAASAGFVYVNQISNAPLTGAIGFKDRLYLFKRDEIYVLYSSDSTSPYDQLHFNIKNIDSGGIGCVSGNAIALDDNRLLWLSDRGICEAVISPFVVDSLQIKIHNKIPELFHNLTLHGNYNMSFLPDRNEVFVTGLSAAGGSLI